MAVVAKLGTGYIGDSPVNFLRVVENPGDAMVFFDATAANTFLTARSAPASVELITGVSGQKNRGKRSNND